uniref:COesterase domain-containing protein n=1 Tax=Strongyloides stercoralis TaxID=6248 RepID=A0A0K0E3P5_STRER
MIWRAILAYGYPWDPEIVIVNKPTITQNDGVYRRIRYGYYTFPSSVQYNTWGPSPHNPPNAPWPPNPPWPPISVKQTYQP